MTAKEYLKRVAKIETQIRHLNVEKQRWAELTIDRATNTASNMSTDKVQSSGDLQKMECAIVSGIDKDNEFDKRIEQLKAERQEIIDVIHSLPALESDILYRRYVEFKMFKEIAFDLNKSYDTVMSIHKRALAYVEVKISH